VSDVRIELAGQGLEAWNRRDVDWLRRNATADFEFVPAVAATVEGGSVKGPEGMVHFLEEMDESWETFRIEPEDFRLVGEVVLIHGRVIAKGRGSGVELDQPIASTTHFRDGKIARLQSYLDPAEALEAASKDLEETR
jgi:ketosteroid isomerase-like protein